MASMVYQERHQEMGLEGDYTLVVVGTVQEEDCDGLCWQYIIRTTHEARFTSSPPAYRWEASTPDQRGRIRIPCEKVNKQVPTGHSRAGDNAILRWCILGELKITVG
jgi:hypothetical protein